MRGEGSRAAWKETGSPASPSARWRTSRAAFSSASGAISWFMRTVRPASGSTQVDRVAAATSITAGRSVENSNAYAAPRAAPSSARVSAGTATVKRVAAGSASSGVKSSPRVPTQRSLPGTFAPSAVRTSRGGRASSSADSSARMERLKSTVTAGSRSSVTVPRGAA
jgi:hypothetical protein